MNVFDYLAKYELLDRVELGMNKLGLDQDLSDRIIYEIFGKWRVVVNHRAKRVAGHVSYTKRILSLTHKFFESEERAEHHIETLLHEVAHIIVKLAYPSAKSHGREWKRVMWSFDLAADRCHDYDYMGMPKRTIATSNHRYECLDCGYEYLTKRELKNIERRHHSGCKRKPNGGKFRHTRLR